MALSCLLAFCGDQAPVPELSTHVWCNSVATPPSPRMLSLAPLLLLLGGWVAAQSSCDNYGTSFGNGTCACPPGFGGDNCALAACGGTIFQGLSRSFSPNATTGLPYSNITSCGCENGWTGLGCNGASRALIAMVLFWYHCTFWLFRMAYENDIIFRSIVCTTSSACQSGYTSAFGSSSSPGVPDGANGTLVCNTSPRVYSGGELSCAVENPTLSVLYPGTTNLNIIRTYNSSLALAPSLTSYGNSGQIHAELFYEGEEQFFCQADSCSVASDAISSNWTCSNLKCLCRPGTSMCGAVKVRTTLHRIKRRGFLNTHNST